MTKTKKSGETRERETKEQRDGGEKNLSFKSQSISLFFQRSPTVTVSTHSTGNTPLPPSSPEITPPTLTPLSLSAPLMNKTQPRHIATSFPRP